MNEFFTALGWVAWGFAAGYFWNSVWEILNKIWTEIKQARKEW